MLAGNDKHARGFQSMRSVGVVGLGQMGRGIARSLDQAGGLAAAWDTNAEALSAAGLSGHVALADVGGFPSLRAVMFVVPSSTEIRSILCGADGLLSKPHKGQVLI